MVFNIDVAIAAGGGGGPTHLDFYSAGNGNAPTMGQTVFPLSATPTVPARVVVVVNGAEYAEGVDGGGYFTVSGATMTWTGPTLGPTDDVEIIY